METAKSTKVFLSWLSISRNLKANLKAIGSVLSKSVLKISQISQENICVGGSF